MSERDIPDGVDDGRDLVDENLAEADDPAGADLAAAERRGMGRGAALGLGLAALVAIAAIALFVIFNPFASGPAPDNTAAVTTLPAPSVGPTEALPPATTAAPSASAAPSETGAATASASPQPTSGESRPIALNRWNWLADQQMFSVGGFIEGRESGGTCTLTAASGGQTLVGSAPATEDASTTICVVNLPATDPTPGEWQLTMTYEGPGGTATSEAVTVTVS